MNEQSWFSTPFILIGLSNGWFLIAIIIQAAVIGAVFLAGFNTGRREKRHIRIRLLRLTKRIWTNLQYIWVCSLGKAIFNLKRARP